MAKFKEFLGEDISVEADTLTLSVPLFIRMLEFAKEDAKDDMELHKATENAMELHRKGVKVLGMVNYDTIVKV